MSGCKFTSSTTPRVVPGRHDLDCEDETCRGCQPCTERHCPVCGIEHGDGACAKCLADVRETLVEIRDRYLDLPYEAEIRGVDGEAAVLIGPAADPEARGHLEASVLAGRISSDYLGEIRRDDHGNIVNDPDPLWVLETWAMVYRDAFDHDEPLGRVDVLSEASYLERNLTYMGDFEHVPFEDFAKDLSRCAGHIKVVLHDQDRGVRANIPCFDCGSDIERKLGDKGFDDVWTCRGRGCGRRYSIAEYNFALRAALEESA